ncbi:MULTISPECIES: o-succinylbenzoate synthase [Prauserella salsuginis group]|uniref:o-succinylbenzoate synthase n=2 Tax=Prauserella salsuginis group TaxID=2893672 RepID=A0A839XUC4_9PSEU|nr:MULTISPECIES: o-succinylbenzoate synthase [Prauserella salsuginis group]MBB3663435.1 O-succinylbenzoate synthase [Prauserella sediminis]
MRDRTIDVDVAGVFALPLRNRFRRITVREGVLLRGPAGWGEFSPFRDYDDAESVPWFAAAIEASHEGWPEPVRDAVEVNTTVPVVPPERAHDLVSASGCRTAKVKVADPRSSLADDCARVEAVRTALGPGGAIRVDANAAWDVDTAVAALRELDRAAGGLEYAEQPCASVAELADVRRRVDVRIAADESIRRAEDPLRVAVAGAADVAVLKTAPLGGVRRALDVAESCGLPCVVSSAVDSSVGLAAGLALAGALPELDFACGLGTASLLTADVTSTPLSAVDGFLPVPHTAPEPDLLADHAADPDTTQWWRDRIRRVEATG